MVDATVWEGQGTAENPYKISTTADWNMLCKTVLASTDSKPLEGKFFLQTAEIDIWQGVGVTGAGNDKAFCGTYDGDGHRLECNIKNPVKGSSEAVAPFHRLNGTTIRNLHLSGGINGGVHSAGLAAYTDGVVTIDNCRVSSEITCTGTNVSDAHGGGIVGHANESELMVKCSLFDGKLIAKANGIGDVRLGAIVGWGGTKVTVESCLENGAYDGMTDSGQTAFCWKDMNNATVSSSFANLYLSDLGHDAGAYKGVTVASGTEDLGLDFDNEYWQEACLGAVFKDTRHSNYIIGGRFYAFPNNTVSFRITYPTSWKNVEIACNGNPLAASNGIYSLQQGHTTATITATYGKVYWTDEGNCATEFSSVDNTKKTVTVTAPAELALLAKQVYDGTNSGDGWTYNLGTDLDMSAYDWRPIGKGLSTRFRGTFDGRDHTVSGIHTESTDQFVGLFGVVNATVRNLKLANSQIEGRRYVGGIAAEVRGTIENCHVATDVTVKAVAADDSNSGQDCGGVAGNVENQSATGDFHASNAHLKGCFSGATVSGKAHIGGIVGNLNSGTVEFCVSGGQVSGNSEVAYVIGNRQNGTAQYNCYVADKESDNEIDVRAYHVTLADNLKESGYSISSDVDEEFNYSELYFNKGSYHDTRYVRQFKMGNEWYAPKAQTISGGSGSADHTVHFIFTVTKEAEGYQIGTVENVRVDGETPSTTTDGSYYFAVNGDVVISGTPAITLYDESNWNTPDLSKNNEAILYYSNGRKVNVTLEGRTLYRDGAWNTICLPFGLVLEGSPLEGATLKTLASSAFNAETGMLTLNFSDNQSVIKAGVPYIIKWPDTGSDISNPRFEGVTISYVPDSDPKFVGEDNVDPVIFQGNYQIIFRGITDEGDKGLLYMGNDSKLYYPDGTKNMSINAFRAVFWLRDDIEAGDSDSPNGIRSFVMNFGDENVTAIDGVDVDAKSAIPDVLQSEWYTLDGRRLNGKHVQKGIYVHGGRKVVVK